MPAFLLVLSSLSFAEGPYEAIGTVNNYDSLRGSIVLDGQRYKLVGNANSDLLVSIRESNIESIVGKEVSYQVNINGNGSTIIDVHVPIENE